MPKIPGVNHRDAVVPNGQRILTLPRHNPVNPCTVDGIVRDARLAVEAFKVPLSSGADEVTALLERLAAAYEALCSRPWPTAESGVQFA